MKNVYRVTKRVSTGPTTSYEACSRVTAGNKRGAVSKAIMHHVGGKVVKVEKLSRVA